MKPWKSVSLILFALAVAAAGYGADSRATRLPAHLRHRQRLKSSRPQRHANWLCHPRIANFAIPSCLPRRTFGEAWSISPFIALRAIRTTEGGKRYSARASIRNRPTCVQPGHRTRAMASSTTRIDNGVRLSGTAPAPSARNGTLLRQTWRLVLFIRHLPQITPEELDEMKGWDSKMEADPAHF